jgi:alpha-galactosidase
VPTGPLDPGDSQSSVFRWGHSRLSLRFQIGADGVARLAVLGSEAESSQPHAVTRVAEVGLPLVEVQLTGTGRHWSGERSVETVAGARLRYQGHEESRDGQWLQLRIDLADPVTGLSAQAYYRSPQGVGAVQSWVRLANAGTRRLVVEAVTSFAISGLSRELTAESTPGADGARDRLADLDLMWVVNDWLAEGRWQRRELRGLLVDLNRGAHQHDPRGCFSRSSQGSWSSGRYLPMGALVDRGNGRTLLWQVESSGGWRWEVGERAGTAYLALLGPTDREHQWRTALEPGEAFTSVPAAVAISATTAASATAPCGTDGFADAVAAMTTYRRAIRRPHPDHTGLPVVYNDYMNTLMGDPTAERLLPLIDAAAEAGAECFVIDAGWYDDGGGWWDSVGTWQESASRFPGGLTEVLGRIRDAGMTPGLWLEPEVVGVRSPIAARLPEDAFFQRDGVRVVEHGRHHLDLRHPAAVKHLDQVVDRLVSDYSVVYLKLDYNINPGPGTDLGGSAGAGLLGHQRAYTAWLASILDRHPGLTLENCASGGMRTDYGLLSHAQVQSTSDQQDFLRYPPIAAAAPAAITPEQVAIWAYPQPEFTDDEIAFTLCGALLGRPHLSGHFDRMSPGQRALVADAVAVHKQVRADIPAATPFWPLGDLPAWTDPWFALGQRGPDATGTTTYLTVWHRDDPRDTTRTLSVPHLRGRQVAARTLYPARTKSTHPDLLWDADAGKLTVTLPRTRTACLIALEPPVQSRP